MEPLEIVITLALAIASGLMGHLNTRLTRISAQLAQIRENPKPTRTLEEVLRLQHELHEWHSPDTNGRQDWKDTRPMVERLDRVIELLEKMVEGQRRSEK